MTRIWCCANTFVGMKEMIFCVLRCSCALSFGSISFVSIFLSLLHLAVEHASASSSRSQRHVSELSALQSVAVSVKTERPKQNLPRLHFCAKCLKAMRFCSRHGCVFPAAPSFKKDEQPSLCSVHYGDPAHASSHCWRLCSNAALVCRRLSMEPSLSTCFACRARKSARVRAFVEIRLGSRPQKKEFGKARMVNRSIFII